MINFYIGNEWDNILKDVLQNEKISRLKKILDIEYNNYTIYPKQEDIFNALKNLAPQNIKVVILGQDPYYSTDKRNNVFAHGYAFSSHSPYEIPKSLQNIFKEIKNEYPNTLDRINGNLEYLVSQGVLLLNTILTVRKGSPLSHSNIGWQVITDRIIEYLGTDIDQPIVFLLWGNSAAKYKTKIKNKNKLVITTSHPSPLSAYHSFFNSGIFIETNNFLKQYKIKEIEW